MDPIVVGSVTATAAALIGYAFYQRSIGAELRRASKETSRFPLFAARDALILLVGEDKMDETDPAWRNMYRGLNSLLSMDNELHLLDCLLRYATAQARMDEDPGLKRRFLTAIELERKAASRIPEFAVVRTSVDQAFAHLVQRRTRTLHIAGLLAIRLLGLALFRGLNEAKETRRQIRKPSGTRYRGWVATRDELPVGAAPAM